MHVVGEVAEDFSWDIEDFVMLPFLLCTLVGDGEEVQGLRDVVALVGVLKGAAHVLLKSVAALFATAGQPRGAFCGTSLLSPFVPYHLRMVLTPIQECQWS